MKILVIRFSSIGDIVLTTPVIRSLKQAKPACEVHFLTKAGFKDVLAHNPYIDSLHLLEKDGLGQMMGKLRAEKFDFILDLHHNLRSWRVRLALGVAGRHFDKANLRKYAMTHGRGRGSEGNLRPLAHIVARYGETLRPLGVALDEGGLDFFLPPGMAAPALPHDAPPAADFPLAASLAVVLGATHATKRWIPAHFVETLNSYGKPVVLIGGKDARTEADFLAQHLTVPCRDAVGKHSLLASAALMRACGAVLTHDTGFMHIAAAFGMTVHSLWGNTVPEFGMTPYKTPHTLLEVAGLSCRPCSKIGYDRCPQGHFRCMNDLAPAQVLAALAEKAH